MLENQAYTVGQAVLTADQRRLGLVAEFQGPFIRVRRFLRRGFWLSTEYVLWSDARSIVMVFGKPDLPRYERRHISHTPEPVRAFAPIIGRLHQRQAQRNLPTDTQGGSK